MVKPFIGYLFVAICLYCLLNVTVFEPFAFYSYSDHRFLFDSDNDIPPHYHSDISGNGSLNEGPLNASLGDHRPIYIVWSRWRSGSSFLGQLLAYAKTNVFYSYEPLHAFGLHVFRGRDLKTNVAMRFLFDIMSCNYKPYQRLVDYFVDTEFYFFYNPLTKKSCRPIKGCNSTNLLSGLCQGAKMHIIKLLRLSLKYGETVLRRDPRIKIIYLARDPRATMKSRSELSWCSLKDCRSPQRVCDLLHLDIQYSQQLLQKYPDRFRFLRYEDLAMETERVFGSLWEWLGHPYSKRVERLIKAFTSEDLHKGIYGLQRDSKRNVFAWRSSLDLKFLKEIQGRCDSVMKELGYAAFLSKEDYENGTIVPLAGKWNSALNRV